jgi:hypothetical protein
MSSWLYHQGADAERPDTVLHDPMRGVRWIAPPGAVDVPRPSRKPNSRRRRARSPTECRNDRNGGACPEPDALRVCERAAGPAQRYRDGRGRALTRHFSFSTERVPPARGNRAYGGRSHSSSRVTVGARLVWRHSDRPDPVCSYRVALPDPPRTGLAPHPPRRRYRVGAALASRSASRPSKLWL